jgi:LmbE family N-acetylglucosaminyl deacetylase
MSKVFIDLKPSVVLGVAAHPDDLDVTSSGTLAKFAKDGAKIYYLILTDGGKGSNDRALTPHQLTSMRHQEQAEAAEVISAQPPIFLDFKDGELEVNLELKKQIVKVIRQVKPDLVITMDPANLYSLERGMINHPDHRAAGQATLDAVFPLARDHLAFPELMDEGLEPHKVMTILLTNFEGQNFFVDISSVIDKKVRAICAHKSQFGDPEAISQRMKEMSKAAGEKAGFDYAEGFKRIDMMY